MAGLAVVYLEADDLGAAFEVIGTAASPSTAGFATTSGTGTASRSRTASRLRADPAVGRSRCLNPGPAARLERAPDKMQMTISDADEFYLRS